MTGGEIVGQQPGFDVHPVSTKAGGETGCRGGERLDHRQQQLAGLFWRLRFELVATARRWSVHFHSEAFTANQQPTVRLGRGIAHERDRALLIAAATVGWLTPTFAAICLFERPNVSDASRHS